MKISYRREMKHNYMIIDPEALVWKNYECHMLASNTMDGVLRFQIRQMDDEIRFYYEITSKQPLSRLLESQSIQAEEIRMLILGISSVLDRMETYLLRESCVLLEPDQIYVEPETFRIWLCLVPGLEQDFPESYGKLLEYLLGKVNHQDKDSVVLAYGLYQETRKENYGMEDILRLLYEGQEVGVQPAGQEAPEPPMQYAGEVTRDSLWQNPGDGAANTNTKKKKRQAEERWMAERKTAERQADTETAEKVKKRGIWGRIRVWWDARRRNQKQQEMVQVPWEMLFHEDEPDPAERELRGHHTPPKSDPQAGAGMQPVSDTRVRQNIRSRQEAQSVRNIQSMQSMRSVQSMQSVRNIQPMQCIQSGQDVQPMQSTQSMQSTQPAQPWQGAPMDMIAQPGADTILLADMTQKSSETMHRLRALDPEREDILLSYYPFVIGKQANLVDYLLAESTVSRLHLRIDREQEHYYAQDLNSTNGTTINGILLENNATAELTAGMEVCIAKCRYRFE